MNRTGAMLNWFVVLFLAVALVIELAAGFGYPALQPLAASGRIVLFAWIVMVARLGWIAAKMPRTPWVAIGIATALTVLFGTRVFVSFSPVRVRAVVQSVASTAGSVEVRPDARTGVSELRVPFAVIARIRNDTEERRQFTIQIDGQRVCRPSIAAHRTERVDCAVRTGWSADAAAHTVLVDGPPGAWALEYFELATHHGGSSGLTDLRIVPVRSTVPVRPAVIDIVLAWLAILATFLLPRPVGLPRPVVLAHRVLGGLLWTVLAVSVVLPFVSPYALVISAATFWRWCAVLAALRLWQACRIAMTLSLLRTRRALAMAVCLATSVAVCAVYTRVAQKLLVTCTTATTAGSSGSRIPLPTGTLCSPAATTSGAR